MRRFYVSELDARAPELALERGMGLEIIGFCAAERMEDEELIASEEVRLRPYARKSLHAPYYELAPCAIDPLIREVSLKRYCQAVATCMRLGIRRMVVHSGFAPRVYYPEWFVPRSIEFWRDFVRELPEDFELLLENVLDVHPEYIRDVCDGVDDPRLRICLDNNDGLRDLHAPLDEGSLDVERVLRHLDSYAPAADICIESVDALSCIRTLEKRGVITDEKSL